MELNLQDANQHQSTLLYFFSKIFSSSHSGGERKISGSSKIEKKLVSQKAQKLEMKTVVKECEFGHEIRYYVLLTEKEIIVQYFFYRNQLSSQASNF